VSASILTVSSGVNRLVLTTDITGSSGIELVENGGSNVLSSLGLVSASLVANTIDGDARSYGFTTSTTALSQTLGLTMPAAGSFKVNGSRVDVDLSQDSLATIAERINTAAGADTAKISTEVVNGSTVSRLIVNGTVTANTDDGAAAEAISTASLQQLGFLKNDRGAGMQLLAPTDAKVVIDGIPVTRSTNVISDAMAGVTLTLQQAELGAKIDLSVGRDDTAAVTAVKDYAAAYNGAAAFVATNTGAKGPLAFDSSIRATMREFTSVVLDSVVGLSNSTFTTGAAVGVSLDKTGRLQVDEAKLKAALTSNPDEVRSLFTTSGRSTLDTVRYMAGSSKTQPGTYAVAVTQAATTPAATGSAMGGAYGNAATANTMKVTDSFTGKTATITLADGDTAAVIAGRLNVAFGANGLRVGASVVGGNQLQLTGLQFGSKSTFTVAFELDGAAAASQLGFASTPYAGIDVAGTINGKPATGAGQLLTALPPALDDVNAAEGLAVLYTDTLPSASASVTYTLGIGGMIFNAADPMVQSGDGQIQVHEDTIQGQIDSASKRAADIQARLDRQRATLVQRFTAMETAISKLQAQSSALTSQLNALQQQTS
jgi:flagellar hook-associated protein 2